MSAMLLAAPVLAWWGTVSWFSVAAAWLAKSAAEGALFARSRQVFQRRDLHCQFLPWTLSQPLYIAAVGLFGALGRFDWKGRSYRWGVEVDRRSSVPGGVPPMPRGCRKSITGQACPGNPAKERRWQETGFLRGASVRLPPSLLSSGKHPLQQSVTNPLGRNGDRGQVEPFQKTAKDERARGDYVGALVAHLWKYPDFIQTQPQKDVAQLGHARPGQNVAVELLGVEARRSPGPAPRGS